ncbi:MAG: hypothetical protein NTU44_16930, partial [Bacteroidetes bacterium]|nr:hypothetical protein [Bacteroidota bacterium]
MQNNPLSARLIRLLQHIAIISAVFGIMLCFLIIINFLQTKKADPLNSKAMNTLVQRWQANPGDEQLKNEIRELDLLARKAFFTNQWQVQTGGLLLFASIVLVIICLQAIQLHRKKNPQIEPGKTENFFEKRKRSRKWIAGSGILLAGISFLLVFLTHHDLERELERTSKSSLTKGALLPGTMGNNGNPEAITGDSTKPSGNQTVSDFPDEQELISNYPSFRGPGGNGIAFQKNVPTDWDGKTGKNIRWKTAIP